MRARIFLVLLLVVSSLTCRLVAAPTTYGVNVVVLDAGHGGNDPGAVYGGVRESDLTLKVVLRLGKKIEAEMPGVKVVYTRTSDRALAPTKIEDLQKRADIANRAEGDLFVSVHVNAAKSTKARGVETLIMGETEKEQSRNEDALYATNRDDLLDMSDAREAAIVRAYIQNLQFTYGQYSEAMARCIQNRYQQSGRQSRGIKRQPLRVLYATNMPGVLTEIGFLSNSEDAAVLKSDKGLNKIVEDIYRAIRDYSDYVLEARRAEEKPLEKVVIGATVEPSDDAPIAAKEAPRLYDPRLYKAPNGNQQASAVQPEQPAKSTSQSTVTPTKKKPEAPVTKSVERIYTVQVLASKKVLSLQSNDFKSYRGRVHQYESTGPYRYKYGVGCYHTRDEAIEAATVVRRTFPQAFVVAVEGGRTVN